MGMLIRGKFPTVATSISRYTPFASVLLVSLLCGGVVAQNVQMLASAGAVGAAVSAATTTTTATALSTSVLLPSIILAVLLVHCIGFMAGYIIPRYGFSQSTATSRTISIEVGMQNSALPVVLAKSIHGLHPIATLPGAFSATIHSCLGSILATIWRRYFVTTTTTASTAAGDGDTNVSKIIGEDTK
jgi:bile acid:Na+ symporter, BASS family